MMIANGATVTMRFDIIWMDQFTSHMEQSPTMIEADFAIYQNCWLSGAKLGSLDGRP